MAEKPGCFRNFDRLCCAGGCDHPPDCDHVDHGTYTTEWQPVWSGSVIRRWLEGAVWCNRCRWWLRQSEPPQEYIDWQASLSVLTTDGSSVLVQDVGRAGVSGISDDWESTPAGKAATQRFVEMCERGEIFAASSADLPPIEFAEDPVEDAVAAFDKFVQEWIAPRHHAHLMDNDTNDAERVRRAIRATREVAP